MVAATMSKTAVTQPHKNCVERYRWTIMEGIVFPSTVLVCFLSVVTQHITHVWTTHNVRDITPSRGLLKTPQFTLFKANDLRWREACSRSSGLPFQCSIVDVSTFLLELLDKNLSFSTFKVYLAGISACHVRLNRVTPGAHPLTVQFLKGVCRLRPLINPKVPSWAWAVALRGSLSSIWAYRVRWYEVSFIQNCTSSRFDFCV